jgi:hypothetical protein
MALADAPCTAGLPDVSANLAVLEERYVVSRYVVPSIAGTWWGLIWAIRDPDGIL